MLTTVILFVHVISGFLALVTGAIALGTEKGKANHVKAGTVFFESMVLVAVSALYLSLVSPNLFLLFIAIFNFYLTWSGYRAVRWKDKPLKGWIRLFNYTIIPAISISGLLMITIALAGWFGMEIPDSLQGAEAVLLVFGFINTAFSGRDLFYLFHPEQRNNSGWIYRHISGMGGAYIATITAFLVVNLTFLPALVVWLAPTVVGSPLIAWGIRRYRMRGVERAEISR